MNAERVPSRRRTAACFLAAAVLLMLPLMALALLDIAQGGEDLTLEWLIVVAGLTLIAVEQTALLALLGGLRPQPSSAGDARCPR